MAKGEIVRDLMNRLFDGSKRPEELETGGEPTVPAVPSGGGQDEPLGEPTEDGAAPSQDVHPATAPGEEAAAMIDDEITRPMRRGLADTAVIRRTPDPLTEPESEPWIRSAMRCHTGRVRARNEDSVLAFEAQSGGQEPLLSFGLYIVADGMGGHHAGHEASKQVSRMVARHVLERIYLPLLQEAGSAGGAPREPIREVMLDAVQEANRNIHSSEPDKDSGTTLTAALIFGRRLYIAHVGDSRAYVMTDGPLKPVTTDHSYVRRLQDAGQLTEEEAAAHPQRNMLYKAVGQGGQLEIDTFTQVLPARGKIMLCSDGLWGLVPNSVMQQTLQGGEDLQETAEVLIQLALDAGGGDNISVILVEFRY